eukprot:6208617-Prymnesium_polylepis.1
MDCRRRATPDYGFTFGERSPARMLRPHAPSFSRWPAAACRPQEVERAPRESSSGCLSSARAGQRSPR